MSPNGVFNTNKTYIISEISCNHNGSLDEAMRILHGSKQAGADCVKLQTYTADTISRDFKTKPKGTIWEDTDLYALYKKAYTPWEWQIELKAEADRLGIDLISTPFDETAVDFLVNEVKVPMLKLASFETVDTKLLAKVAKTGLPIIMSNGMMDFRELLEAVTVLRQNGTRDLTLLQCNSGYPAIFEDANLATMAVMKEMFDCTVGVSDHTLFVDTVNYTNPKPHITPLEAVKLGAKIVEVHVMTSRAESKELMEKGEGGFDWPFSRELDELKKMTDMIRAYERGENPQYESEEEHNLAKLTHGSVCFDPTPKEINARAIRPSLWIVKDIKKGEKFVFAAESANKERGNFDSIRPGGGLHIRFTDIIEDKTASQDIKAGTPLSWDMVNIV